MRVVMEDPHAPTQKLRRRSQQPAEWQKSHEGQDWSAEIEDPATFIDDDLSDVHAVRAAAKSLANRGRVPEHAPVDVEFPEPIEPTIKDKARSDPYEDPVPSSDSHDTEGIRRRDLPNESAAPAPRVEGEHRKSPQAPLLDHDDTDVMNREELAAELRRADEHASAAAEPRTVRRGPQGDVAPGPGQNPNRQVRSDTSLRERRRARDAEDTATELMDQDGEK